MELYSWNKTARLTRHRESLHGIAPLQVLPSASPPLAKPGLPRLARDNRQELKELLPANVPESFLDRLLMDRPDLSVGDACKAIIRESRQIEQAYGMAALVNQMRGK